MVWSFSGIVTYGHHFLSWSTIGHFLVCSPLSSHLGRYLLNSIYSSPMYSSSLASSTHQLPSSLVPSLGLSLVSVPTNFDGYAINLQEQQLFFDNCLTRVSLRLVTFAVTLLRRRPPSITVGAQDLQAFTHCRPSRSPRNSMCPRTTLECVLLEIWLRSPHNRWSHQGRGGKHPWSFLSLLSQWVQWCQWFCSFLVARWKSS